MNSGPHAYVKSVFHPWSHHLPTPFWLFLLFVSWGLFYTERLFSRCRYFSCFFVCLVIVDWMPDYKKFTTFAYWLFLYTYKYSWEFFWNIWKLLGNSLIFWTLALRFEPEQHLAEGWLFCITDVRPRWTVCSILSVIRTSSLVGRNECSFQQHVTAGHCLSWCPGVFLLCVWAVFSRVCPIQEPADTFGVPSFFDIWHLVSQLHIVCGGGWGGGLPGAIWSLQPALEPRNTQNHNLGQS